MHAQRSFVTPYEPPSPSVRSARSALGRVRIVLNARSGILLDHDPATIRAEIKAAIAEHGELASIELASGRAIVRGIDQALRSGCDTLIVGGGDGSVSYAASKLAGTGVTLGVLPLGTINLLGRDLNMPTDLDSALLAITDAQVRPMDLAQVNGEYFHSISGVGFFAQMARAREETRDLPTRLLRIAAAAWRSIERTNSSEFEVEIDGRRGRYQAYAVLVTNNSFDGDDWRRARLDAGQLEVHIAEGEGAFTKLKAGADLLTGAWRDNESIQSYKGSVIVIRRQRRHSWIAIDGELKRRRNPLHYSIQSKALKVLMAANRPIA